MLVLALLLGGVAAAPVAAWATRRIPTRPIVFDATEPRCCSASTARRRRDRLSARYVAVPKRLFLGSRRAHGLIERLDEMRCVVPEVLAGLLDVDACLDELDDVGAILEPW